jgi:hypothetical protein
MLTKIFLVIFIHGPLGYDDVISVTEMSISDCQVAAAKIWSISEPINLDAYCYYVGKEL